MYSNNEFGTLLIFIQSKNIESPDDYWKALSAKSDESFETVKFSNDVDADKLIINGKPALRLYKSVPTFDFYDREYDGLREMFFIPGKAPGTIDGLYVASGYKIASMYYCKHLFCISPKLKILLKKAGV